MTDITQKITNDGYLMVHDFEGIIQDGLIIRVSPERKCVWACTPMRWINIDPIFEFITPFSIIDGKVYFQYPGEREGFLYQLGHLVDRDYSDELFPGVRFDSHTADVIRCGFNIPGKPVWFSDGRVNTLSAIDHYHEWCISTIGDDITTTTLFNPVKVDRLTFQRSRETTFSANRPVTLI